MSAASRPRIHIGPEAEPQFVEAVERGGGTVVDAAQAEAFVWLSGRERLAETLHPGVRWVQLPGAGIEGWLSAGAIDDRRTYTSAVGAYATPVAEHTLALMLAGTRKLHTCARADRWGDRSTRFGRELVGSTVAIVGCGGIGEALIGMLAPLRVRVVAVTRSGRTVPGAAVSLSAAEVEQVWPTADFVVIAAPATADTRHLVSAAQLAAMPAHAWLVNVARGSLVDTEALTRALADDWIGGAALDVTEPEPLPDGHPLWREPRALISPHSANPTPIQRRYLAQRVTENVARFACGEELIGRVDLDAGY